MSKCLLHSARMNRKQQFLLAVRILAPNDALLYEAAKRVREDDLPIRPGGVALQFVCGLQRVISVNGASEDGTGNHLPWRNSSICHHPHADYGMESGGYDETEVTHEGLAMKEALQVRSAEYWLSLGQPVQALAELQRLTESTRNHPWATKVLLRAIGCAREFDVTTAFAS